MPAQRIPITFLVFLTLLLPACTSSNLVDRADWLVGRWENDTPRGTVIEEWSRDSRRSMAGSSTMEQNGEIVPLETIRIIQQGDFLFYIPTVPDQNDGAPVRFWMTEHTPRSLVFENPDHDFPQVIAYRRVGADSLMATISGTIEGEGRSMSFPMRRVDRD